MRTLHSPQRRKRGGPLARVGLIVGMVDSGVAGVSESCMGSFRGKRWRENKNRGLAPCAYHGRGRACFSDVVVSHRAEARPSLAVRIIFPCFVQCSL